MMTEWQPIETAPKDGTPIVIWTSYRTGCNEPRVVIFHNEYSNMGQPASERLTWQDCGGLMYGIHASHWMPLPAPPQEPQR